MPQALVTKAHMAYCMLHGMVFALDSIQYKSAVALQVITRLDTKTIQERWRGLVEADVQWSRAENQAGAVQGEAGGFYVTSPHYGRRAYLKPAVEHPDDLQHCRAAREKIASDLAYDLDLPVPPACLCTHELRPVVLSLVMYPKQHMWSLIRRFDSPDTPAGLAMAARFAECAPMYVFDTWVDQQDHDDHPHNIIWGYDPFHLHDSKIFFLDYANSMGFDGSWGSGGWQPVHLAAFPDRICRHQDSDDLSRCIDDIENLPQSDIEDVVNRIPNKYLPPNQKRLILQGLLGRRSHLRATFSSLLNEGSTL